MGWQTAGRAVGRMATQIFGSVIFFPNFPSSRLSQPPAPSSASSAASLLCCQPRRLPLAARLFVSPPVQRLEFQAAVHHGAAAGAPRELFDRLLRLCTRGEGAITHPVLGDVVAFAGIKLVDYGPLTIGDASLQHATRSQHVGHLIRQPLAEHGCVEGWPMVLR